MTMALGTAVPAEYVRAHRVRGSRENTGRAGRDLRLWATSPVL